MRKYSNLTFLTLVSVVFLLTLYATAVAFHLF